MIIMAMMFVWINRVIAIRISKPIMKLDDSVKGMRMAMKQIFM